MSQNFKRSHLMTRLVGLIYSWWNIYARLAVPDKHAEAITSRKIFLKATGRLVKHSGQRIIKLCSAYNINGKIANISLFVSRFYLKSERLLSTWGQHGRGGGY